MTGKKNNRDDFSPKTITALRRRAGNRCSNPDHRVPTDAPSDEGPEKVNSIGEAAHITAAAEGGPRYNKALKPDERRAITNGIWLCANCADKIDKDEKTYPVALLHEWKRKAEESAKHEQGRKLPAEQDAVNTLVAAATGQTSIFLPNLVPNAIKAESSYWEKIDPRFAVEMSYRSGIIGYTLFPKKTATFKMIVNYPHVKEVNEKFNELIKHGSDIAIDLSAVKFEGLPIVEKFSEYVKGVIKFENLKKRDIIIKIKTVSPNSIEESFFYDLHGYAVFGTESIRIEAQGLNGVVSINIKLPSSADVVEFTFGINFNLWDGYELNSIPYFDGIYDIHRDIKSKWKINFSIESNGMPFLSFSCEKNDHFSDRFFYLDFIRMVRVISKKLGYQIYYSSSFKITDDLYFKIKEIYEFLSQGTYKFPFQGSVRMELTVSSCLSKLLTRCNSEDIYFLFKHEQTENEQISLFRQDITIPKLSRTFTKAKLKTCGNYKNIKAGDLVEIELIPADNCECILEKASDIIKEEKVGIVE